MTSRRIGILISILLLYSCADDPLISSSIEGSWNSTTAEIEARPYGLPIPYKQKESIELRLEFTPDGTLMIQNASPPREGTWSLSGDELKIGIDYVVEDITLSGTYTIEKLTESELILHRKIKGQVLVNPDHGPNVTGRVKVTLFFQRM